MENGWDTEAVRGGLGRTGNEIGLKYFKFNLLSLIFYAVGVSFHQHTQ
jgi:hypothetical protein